MTTAALNTLSGALARHAIAEYSAAEESGTINNILRLADRKKQRLNEAIRYSQQAVTNLRETGDRHNEGMAMLTLSHNLYLAERLDEAVASAKSSVAQVTR